MARLTDEERSFRKMGAGIPLSRWWPIPVTFIGIICAMIDPFLFSQCIGIELPAGRGKAALVEIGIATVCSPLLLKGSMWEWVWFALIWLPMPFAVVNILWMRRHRAYWNKVREREAENRRKRKQAKPQGNGPTSE